MNWESLIEKMFEKARRDPPSMEVPVGFEHRVMAHVRSRGVGRATDGVVVAWWRAAWSCSLVAVMLVGWTYSVSRGLLPSELPEDELEAAMAADVV